MVRGRVQGVGFRYFAREYAQIEGLHGWVTNRPDGAVEVLAEGDREALGRFEGRLRKGPPAARVDDVLVIDDVPTGESRGFDIRH